ncbi:phage tail tape measure protein [Vibrio parahaemolyticus]
MTTSSSVKLNLVLGLVDKLTAPIQKVTNQTTKAGEKIQRTEKQLKELGALSGDIDHFRKLKKESKQTGQALEEAQSKVSRLAAEMKATGKPTRTMTQAFKLAQSEAAKLKSRHEGETAQLQTLRSNLNQAGVSTKNLNEATRKIRGETERYNAELKSQQKELNQVADRQNRMAEISKRNSDMRMTATTDAVGVGAAIFGAKKLVDAYGQVASAQGEIQSLGIDPEGIDVITQKAKEFSNQWAGTTQADFIKASYDIKSGISSLSDEAVAEYTRIAGLTALATKSTTGEMTNLFASGFAIYRDQFDSFGAKTITGWSEMSDAEKNMKFGEHFSAGISASVQMFKTDGSKLSQAISTLGATATSAGQSFQEQLSVLGMLSATMGGGEAATKYARFLEKAGQAGDKLGLNFRNANGQLLESSEIIAMLSERYNGALTDMDKAELVKAFGTSEAVDMIDLLLPKVDQLKSSTADMGEALKGGIDKTMIMAKAIGEGPAESMERLGQRVTNLAVSVGALLAPAMMFASDTIGEAASFIGYFTEQFPLLSQVVAYTVVGLVTLKSASIAGRFAFSYFSDAIVMARKVLMWFNLANLKNVAIMTLTRARTIAAVTALVAMTTAQKAMAAGSAIVTGAQWALNAAMMANPIGLVIAGVMALIAAVALIARYWEPLGTFFSGLWSSVTTSFSIAWEFIKSIVTFSPVGLLFKAWEPLVGFFSGLLGAIKGVFSSGLKWIESAILSPIQTIKDTLGAAWSALFGGDNVEVSAKVKQVADQVPAATNPAAVATTPTGEPVATVPGKRGDPVVAQSSKASVAPVFKYGDIIIQAAPGMDAEAIAREVRRQLDDRDRQAATKYRGRLYD